MGHIILPLFGNVLVLWEYAPWGVLGAWRFMFSIPKKAVCTLCGNHPEGQHPLVCQSPKTGLFMNRGAQKRRHRQYSMRNWRIKALHRDCCTSDSHESGAHSATLSHQPARPQPKKGSSFRKATANNTAVSWHWTPHHVFHSVAPNHQPFPVTPRLARGGG